jgi:hypothetical protein
MRPALTGTGWKKTSRPVQGWGAVHTLPAPKADVGLKLETSLKTAGNGLISDQNTT